MKIKIEKLEKTVRNYDSMWLFIEDKKSTNYRFRWAIAHRKDGWWGVVAMFPSTHENAIDRIAEEMELAKRAIVQLKGNLLDTLDTTSKGEKV